MHFQVSFFLWRPDPCLSILGEYNTRNLREIATGYLSTVFTISPNEFYHLPENNNLFFVSIK
jgi:hypothetical protein